MAVDPQLAELLHVHRDRHWVHYGADALTDHGPMAYLALAGLGASTTEIERHASAYAPRLEHAHAVREAIDARSYPSWLGTLAAYPAFVRYFDRMIAELGTDATLRRHLPELASGWVRDAYHATIRLGYGIEFDVPSEIAAGLAYLAAVGPDERLAAVAASNAAQEDPLAAARARLAPQFVRGVFAERYDAVMQAGVVAACLPHPTDALRRAARAALGVFDATHGFFALHLVTGSHAFRVCAPYIGADAERLLWAGITAGYLAIGAPLPQRAAETAPRTAAPDLAVRDGEHLIKLAWSARSQAAAFDDAAFTDVVSDYLGDADPRRLG